MVKRLIECPEGKVMCQLCFECTEYGDLNDVGGGKKEDVCKGCADIERYILDHGGY